MKKQMNQSRFFLAILFGLLIQRKEKKTPNILEKKGKTKLYVVISYP